MKDINIDIEKVKARFCNSTVQFTYPSVIPMKRSGTDISVWLALYTIDGIPQHCQCSSEAEGWYLIDHYNG